MIANAPEPKLTPRLVPELFFRQQGLIATPILVGRRAAEVVAAVVDTVQVNPYTGGRTPMGGIQYMRGKKSH